jgi:hypothetical protein
MMAQSWPGMLPALEHVHCGSCKGLVELSCAGLGGTVMYETYNEYFCPYCRKQNHARTPGHIVSARPGPTRADQK